MGVCFFCRAAVMPESAEDGAVTDGKSALRHRRQEIATFFVGVAFFCLRFFQTILCPNLFFRYYRDGENVKTPENSPSHPIASRPPSSHGCFLLLHESIRPEIRLTISVGMKCITLGWGGGGG